MQYSIRLDLGELLWTGWEKPVSDLLHVIILRGLSYHYHVFSVSLFGLSIMQIQKIID